MTGVAFAEFLCGIVLTAFFARRLTEGLAGITVRLGISERAAAAVFAGFAPGHLAVGLAAALAGESGIALGVVTGGAMAALTLLGGGAALAGAARFERASRWSGAFLAPAVLLGGGLGVNGVVSRRDGLFLLAAFVLVVLLRMILLRRNALAPVYLFSRMRHDSVGDRLVWALLGASLLALAIGAGLVLAGSRVLMSRFGISGMVWGMAVLPLLLVLDQLVKLAPLAPGDNRGRVWPEMLSAPPAAFLFNAGVIALAAPVLVGPDELMFYLPLCLCAAVAVSLFVWSRAMPRWAGGLLLLLYAVFFGGGFAGWL